jgi:hypothetical protein
MGGEPLLNPLVAEYARCLRSADLAPRLGLCTNGILLDRADQTSPALFDELDFLDVLVYPTPFRERVLDNIGLIRFAYPRLKVHPMSPSHFWYEDFRSRIPDGAVVERIWSECGMKNCNAIYQGRFVRCVQTYRKPKFLAEVGVRPEDAAALARLEDWSEDSVPLDSPTLAADLAAFLARNHPLEACNWCLGQSGRDIPHAQRERGFEPPLFDAAMLKWPVSAADLASQASPADGGSVQ